MTDAHKVVDYLKNHFGQSDAEIVLFLSQGTIIMKDIQKQMMKTEVANIPGFDDYLLQKLEKIDTYLSDVIERFDMIAVINIIDEKTNRVLQPEYRMLPTDVQEQELSIRYDFHFCINVAKPLFNKEGSHDRF